MWLSNDDALFSTREIVYACGRGFNFPLVSTELQNNFEYITRAGGGKRLHRTIQAVPATDQRSEVDLP